MLKSIHLSDKKFEKFRDYTNERFHKLETKIKSLDHTINRVRNGFRQITDPYPNALDEIPGPRPVTRTIITPISRTVSTVTLESSPGQSFVDTISSLVASTPSGSSTPRSIHASVSMPEPIASIMAPITQTVFHYVTKFITENTKSTPKFIQKAISNSTEVLQLLEERNQKAIEKYQKPLTLTDPVDSFTGASQKLGDAIFHLIKVRETKNPKFPFTNNQLKTISLIKGLYKVVQNLINEM